MPTTEIFPRIRTISLLAAQAGSLVRIPRGSDSLLALVTDEPRNNDACSLVILNSTNADRPRAELVNNWPDTAGVLSYGESVRYELSMEQADVETSRRAWTDIAGVLVSIDEDLFVRSTLHNSMFNNIKYVNLQTGAVFRGNIPNYSAWAFGVWSVWVRDPAQKKCFSLFEFNIHDILPRSTERLR
jgi:hypothetical protein